MSFHDMKLRVLNRPNCKIKIVDYIDGNDEYGVLYIGKFDDKVQFGDLIINVTKRELMELLSTSNCRFRVVKQKGK